MEEIVKRIVIEQKVTKEKTTANVSIEGFNDFEVLGLLKYYLEIHQVNMFKKNNSTENK